jgi:hypothetical protein
VLASNGEVVTVSLQLVSLLTPLTSDRILPALIRACESRYGELAPFKIEGWSCLCSPLIEEAKLFLALERKKYRMGDRRNRVCPVERAGSLDSRFRRWLQNPRKILSRYIKEGMTVLDLGCGPGFFSIDIARMVGKSGRVIASDLQEGMLQKIRDKIHGTEFEERITLHQPPKGRIGVSENVDFVLAFYMIHEVPNQ